MLSYIDERNVERMIDAKNAEITRKINGDYTLSFIAIDEPDLLEELIVICEGQKYRVKQLSSTMSGNKTLQSVTCKHISFDLIDYYAYDYLTNTVTLDKALQFLFKDTPFTYSISDSIKNQSFEKLGECNKQKLLAKIIEAYGLEYEVDNYHFTFKKKVGHETEFQFRYKANISNVKKDIDTTSLTTYIKGYGKKDDEGNYLCTAEYTSPNAEKFGVRHADPAFDERFTIQSELLEYIKTKINDTPDIVVELDYTQIDSTQPINLGDYGYLIHEPLQLDLLSRVIEITKKLSTDRQGNNYQNMTYKIGSQKLVKSSFETSKDSITGSIDTGSLDIEIPDIDYDRIQAEIEAGKQEATDKINSGLGGYVTKTRNELLIMDTEDKATARNLWRWNINGLGFSSNGYSGPYATAITNDGKINADRILVGTLDGALIRANTIKANSLEISTVQKINAAITADDATAIMNTQLEVYDGNIKTHINTVSESKKTEAINSANQNTTSAINSAKTELNQNINTAKSDLTGKINLKANASDVYGKSEVYTKTQTDSAIKQSKDNISLEVSNKYETKVDAEAKITNLQIGGRNLILDSKTILLNGSDNGNGNCSVVEEDYVKIVPKNNGNVYNTNIKASIPRRKGVTYTVSFEILTPTRIGFYWYPSENYSGVYINASTSWQKAKFTYTQTGNDAAHNFLFGLHQLIANNEYRYRNLKLEIGNKATDWSPAPEDVNSLIDTAAINAINSANQNTATVIANYYTKSETDSAINVAKDAINLGVSNKYETKANVETKVSSTLNSAKSYADTKKTEAINSAASDATSKVNAAKSELNTSIGKKANTVDVYSKAEVYTKEQTDSAIKVAKDEINLGVSSTYETKTNVETKVSSTLNSAKSYADTKKTEAINTASTDATNKANQAKTDAINSANNTLTTTIKNYYTKTETDSQINVAKNAITQSVSNTYETKTDSTTKYDTATAIAKAMNNGKIIHEDIAFREGSNNVNLYNNAGNGNVKVERITKPSDCPTTSTHCIRVTTTGTANPGWGGFYQIISSRANAVFIQKIVAKLPTGYQLNTASNSMGTGYTDEWLTSNKGTGKWETYIRQTICGSTGDFSFGGHVYASGGTTPTTSNPLVWYIASCTAIDITDTDERVSSLTTRMSTAESKITDTAITNTVKKNFYTKEETNNQITSKGYQTASQVQQTVDALQLKFTQSGGYNKVRRSKPNETSNLYGFATRPIDGTDLKHDKVYTLTVNGRTVNGTGGRYLVVFIYDTGWNFSKSISIAETVDTTKSISFTIPSTINLNNLQVTSYHYPSGGDRTGSSKVNWYQLTEGSLELPWSPHPSEVYDGITTIDKDGVTVTSSNVNSKTKMSADGFQLIRTTDNKKMFYVNQDGSLEMSGNFTQYDSNGKISIKIANNSYGCYDWLWDGDFVGKLAAFESNRTNTSGANQRFIGIANIADYGNQLVLGVRSSPNSTNFSTYMEIDNTGIMHRDYVTFTANTGFKTNALFRNPSNNNETGRIFGATNNHFFVACNYNNQLRLGYEKNGSYYPGMSIYRNDNTSAGCAIEYYADEVHHNNVVIDGFLSVKGQKNRLVATENFGDRLLNAYETAECYFGDINETIIGEGGEVKVELDEVFLETVNTTEPYQVFLTKYGEGDCYVSERHEKYFVIKGTPNLSVGFEVKAKQRGYEKERLKMTADTLNSPQTTSLEDEAGYTIDCVTTINRG